MINLKNLKKIIKVLKENKDTKQVQGDHYKNFLIEPWLFIKLNKLNSFQAQIVKYVEACYKNNLSPSSINGFRNDPVGQCKKMFQKFRDESNLNMERGKVAEKILVMWLKKGNPGTRYKYFSRKRIYS